MQKYCWILLCQNFKEVIYKNSNKMMHYRSDMERVNFWRNVSVCMYVNVVFYGFWVTGYLVFTNYFVLFVCASIAHCRILLLRILFSMFK